MSERKILVSNDNVLICWTCPKCFNSQNSARSRNVCEKCGKIRDAGACYLNL